MADKKSDLRVVRTRNALRAAFEELIAETTLGIWTVTPDVSFAIWPPSLP